MPSYSIEHIDSYSQKINTAVLSKSKKAKRNIFVEASSCERILFILHLSIQNSQTHYFA